MPTVIYPEVYLWDWITTWIAVTFMAVAACLYPALKAARKKPVEAMRM
jgi:ABC-type lipoprotein release transport system permease subunit